ncbi:hypothetical protein QT327_21655 [Olivibacter sp. 47]|uniref:hypothetical protein n=1 Tax=Olivibacter sp. 47 TaxID=3056486 RepID=UPI0025A3F584|nr:hypothetical protein [Olivibacter sp. 47]MDM8176922.1 hypothetical protein [Olivibacter sp. 47]
MKKKLLLSILLIGCAKVYGQTKLTIPDTRDAVTLPTSYAQAFEVHFKRNTSVNLSLPGTYSTIVGLRGWRDDSGGKAHELAFTNGDIYVRSGLNAGWEAWRKMLSEDINGRVGIGTTSPTDLLEINHGAERKGITLIGEGNASAYTDIGFKKESITALPDGTVWAWYISHRKDGYFSDSASPGTSLEFYGIRKNTGYYAPLSFKSNGDVILASAKGATSGNVGIGTTNPQAKLAVNGNILAKEIKVKTDISVPDYVFEPDYKMLSLSEVENYVKEHKHLPEIPSAKEIGEDGLDLGAMNLLLLKKVEELTLHLIDKDKIISEQQSALTQLFERMENLERQ